MAIEEHFMMLKSGVAEWNQWREKNPNILPNLDNIDFIGADLKYINFNKTSLKGATLSCSDFSYASLKNVDMSNSTIGSCRFNGSDGTESVFNCAYMVGAIFKGAKFKKASFKRSDLKYATFSNSNFSGTTFFNADLTIASLCGSIFEKVDFREAIIVETLFNESNLNNAKFRDSSIRKASFIKSKLISSDFFGIDFNESIFDDADLTCSNLMKAKIIGISLFNTNLYGCKMGFTSLCNLDLSNTHGIDSIVHEGPSIIDVDTLFKTTAILPDIFLRGVGVPEILISYIPSLKMQPIQFYSCFISYSHKDKLFARRLYDSLQGRGIRCWLDDHQMLPGDDIYEQIDRGIKLWDKILLCCSKSSLTSWWVDNEIDAAFEKERKLMKDRQKKVLSIIPLNLDGFLFTAKWESGKKQQIKSRIVANFEGWETNNNIFENEINRVVRALGVGDQSRKIAPKSML